MRAVVARFVQIKELPVCVLLVGVYAYFSLNAPGFQDLSGLIDFARQYSCQALLAVGLTMVIASGGIDISVGSIVGLSAVVLGVLLVRSDISVFGACTIAFVTGAICGAFNGFAVAKLRLQPVVVTLSMMATARGLAYVIAGAGVSTISLPPRAQQLVNLAYESMAPILIAVGFAAAAWVMLTKGSFGRCVLAVGGNEQASRFSGVDVQRVKIIVYVISGALAGLGGIITASMMSTATTDAGMGYEFEAITAVLMGGTSISGGEATVVGSVFGVLTAAMLNRGFGLMGISDLYRMMCLGIMLILAVLLDTIRKRFSRSSRFIEGKKVPYRV
jgi:ribose/xylose/arabinose/galactoside ABC-type transport system permease subunit